MNAALVAWVALLLAATAAADDRVYRCGPDGREYSQAPCPGGTVLDAADARSASQQRETRSAAARDARMAQALVQERRAREAASAGLGVAYLGPARAGGAEPATAQPKRKRKAGHKVDDDPRLTPPLRIAAERR